MRRAQGNLERMAGNTLSSYVLPRNKSPPVLLLLFCSSCFLIVEFSSTSTPIDHSLSSGSTLDVGADDGLAGLKGSFSIEMETVR